VAQLETDDAGQEAEVPGQQIAEQLKVTHFECLVHACADQLQVARPEVDIWTRCRSRNAHTTTFGGRPRVLVSPALLDAEKDAQLWFAAHEVGHLR
jgi:hypothetical protein